MRFLIAALLRVAAVVVLAWPGTLAFAQYCRTQDLFVLGAVGCAMTLAYGLFTFANIVLDVPRRVDVYDYDDIPFRL